MINLQFAQVKAVMFSGLYNDHLEIDQWNKREIAIIDDFLAIFKGKDYKWEDLSILWSEILRLYIFHILQPIQY